MNCEVFSLAPLRCEAFQAKETLRAVLHTILFARTLGVVRARDVDSELFDLTYATCGDPAVERHVEERLDALVRWLAKQDREDDTVARVCLSFYEPKDKRGGGWFGGGDERVYWEQWRVPIEVVGGDEALMNVADREANSAELQQTIVAATQHVLGLVNERKDHIPPVVSADVVSFPYEISLPGETEGALLGSLRRMLTHASPPTLV